MLSMKTRHVVVLLSMLFSFFGSSNQEQDDGHQTISLQRSLNVDPKYSRWPKRSRIPYAIDTGYNPVEVALIKQAISRIMVDLNFWVTFVSVPMDSNEFKIRITPLKIDSFTPEAICYSFPGMLTVAPRLLQLGIKEQRLVLARGPQGCFDGSLHSLMKYLVLVLGKRNEHQRGDRDSFIKVNQENLTPLGRSAYRTYAKNESNWMVFPYDYCSVTHNQQTDFAIDGTAAFVVTQPPFFIPKLDRLSEYDCRALLLLYNGDPSACNPLDCASALPSDLAIKASPPPFSVSAVTLFPPVSFPTTNFSDHRITVPATTTLSPSSTTSEATQMTTTMSTVTSTTTTTTSTTTEATTTAAASTQTSPTTTTATTTTETTSPAATVTSTATTANPVSMTSEPKTSTTLKSSSAIQMSTTTSPATIGPEELRHNFADLFSILFPPKRLTSHKFDEDLKKAITDESPTKCPKTFCGIRIEHAALHMDGVNSLLISGRCAQLVDNTFAWVDEPKPLAEMFPDQNIRAPIQAVWTDINADGQFTVHVIDKTGIQRGCTMNQCNRENRTISAASALAVQVGSTRNFRLFTIDALGKSLRDLRSPETPIPILNFAAARQQETAFPVTRISTMWMFYGPDGTGVVAMIGEDDDENQYVSGLYADLEVQPANFTLASKPSATAISTVFRPCK